LVAFNTVYLIHCKAEIETT